MKTIVALVDLSDLTFKVLKQAHAFASAFQGRLIILHVMGKEAVNVDLGLISPTVMRDPSPEMIQGENDQLQALRDSLAKFGVDATLQQIADPSVDAVLAATSAAQADLIILGSHRHGAFYNLIVGSVTDDILRRARCPVLVVPGDEPAAQKK